MYAHFFFLGTFSCIFLKVGVIHAAPVNGLGATECLFYFFRALFREGLKAETRPLWCVTGHNGRLHRGRCVGALAVAGGRCQSRGSLWLVGGRVSFTESPRDRTHDACCRGTTFVFVCFS